MLKLFFASNLLSPSAAVLELRVRWRSSWCSEVSAASLRSDLFSGLLGALLVLPQGIAFAALAGLPPQYGLYSAVIPTVVAALAGSSRHVVTGPTNANSLALAAMLSPLVATGRRHRGRSRLCRETGYAGAVGAVVLTPDSC